MATAEIKMRKRLNNIILSLKKTSELAIGGPIIPTPKALAQQEVDLLSGRGFHPSAKILIGTYPPNFL